MFPKFAFLTSAYGLRILIYFRDRGPVVSRVLFEIQFCIQVCLVLATEMETCCRVFRGSLKCKVGDLHIKYSFVAS